ncbi:host nuclease inhibitor GamL [Klebsiella quasivariicola]|uniref:host nuclease inhibitor GamL n=1 Tax=Klebsiella quasivariicola TaxID=2026240 RepID=UPI00247A2575|nr:host nuclease inhibitor GamL [Klebsiella quasivariicola]
MSAYAIQDAIQERIEKEHAAALTRDEWVDKRAEEIKSEYPSEPSGFAARHLSADIRLGLSHSRTRDAYQDFIIAASYERAEIEWENLFAFLSEEDFEE